MNLTKVEKKWANVALTSIFAERQRGIRVPFDRIDIDGSLDETMDLIPWRSGMGLRIAIWMIALSPLLLIGRLATITGLTAADRERVLMGLLYNKYYLVRQLSLLFKAFGGLWIFRDPKLREDVLRRSERPLTLGKKKEHAHVAA